MKITFSFGKNWLNYAKNFVQEDALNNAYNSLLRYLPKEEYKNKNFMDVGCGSGIFSLNAIRLGCSEVISFDVDPLSIEATNYLKEKFYYLLPKDFKWEIFQGDILDKNLISKYYEKIDIVYSWGVLHHTGKMWEAIKNCCDLVRPNGYLILAIYNKAPSSEFWLKVKKLYNSAPRFLQLFMIGVVFSYGFLRRTIPFVLRKIKGKSKSNLCEEGRGMSMFYDVIDWLGGYPYEFATFEEIKNFVEKLGFKLISTPTKLPSPKKKFLNRFSFSHTGNNEFVFKKIKNV